MIQSHKDDFLSEAETKDSRYIKFKFYEKKKDFCPQKKTDKTKFLHIRNIKEKKGKEKFLMRPVYT